MIRYINTHIIRYNYSSSLMCCAMTHGLQDQCSSASRVVSDGLYPALDIHLWQHSHVHVVQIADCSWLKHAETRDSEKNSVAPV